MTIDINSFTYRGFAKLMEENRPDNYNEYYKKSGVKFVDFDTYVKLGLYYLEAAYNGEITTGRPLGGPAEAGIALHNAGLVAPIRALPFMFFFIEYGISEKAVRWYRRLRRENMFPPFSKEELETVSSRFLFL